MKLLRYNPHNDGDLLYNKEILIENDDPIISVPIYRMDSSDTYPDPYFDIDLNAKSGITHILQKEIDGIEYCLNYNINILDEKQLQFYLDYQEDERLSRLSEKQLLIEILKQLKK